MEIFIYISILKSSTQDKIQYPVNNHDIYWYLQDIVFYEVISTLFPSGSATQLSK